MNVILLYIQFPFTGDSFQICPFSSFTGLQVLIRRLLLELKHPIHTWNLLCLGEHSTIPYKTEYELELSDKWYAPDSAKLVILSSVTLLHPGYSSLSFNTFCCSHTTASHAHCASLSLMMLLNLQPIWHCCQSSLSKYKSGYYSL